MRRDCIVRLIRPLEGRQVARISVYLKSWVPQVWIFRPGKPRMLEFALSHVPKTGPGAPIICGEN
jgi:hypothetical protein